MFTIPAYLEEVMEDIAQTYHRAVVEDNARHLTAFIEAEPEQIRYLAEGLAEVGYLVVEVRSKADQLVLRLVPLRGAP